MDPPVRTVDYLRISVTDRCDERCDYCRPRGYRATPCGHDLLTRPEIVRVVRGALALGFRKFRLTGGEPLLRPDLVELVGELTALPGVDCVGLSTNGTRLAGVAGALRQAGLRTVNISLDALTPEVYRRITGGRIAPVLDGIRAAVEAGFDRVKLNCVLLRHVNEDELWPLVLFASEHRLPLRLIELMPLSRTDALHASRFLPVDEVVERLRRHDRLVPEPEPGLGFGPARYFRLEATGALVGFIGALTQRQFCETCNRVRLTADGRIRPCLGRHGEVDLRAPLRAGADDTALVQCLREAVAAKPREHGFRECYEPSRPMIAIGG